MRRPSIVALVSISAATVGAIAIATNVVLRLPGLPFNVTELFLDHARPSVLIFFALTLLWIGAGAMVVARAGLCRRRAYLMTPLALVFDWQLVGVALAALAAAGTVATIAAARRLR